MPKKQSDRKLCKAGLAFVDRKLKEEVNPRDKGARERLTKERFAILDGYNETKRNKRKGIVTSKQMKVYNNRRRKVL